MQKGGERMFSNPEGVLKFVKDERIRMIDFKIIDLPGRWHHLSIPVAQLNEKTFLKGIGIDASSYSGYKKVEAGDMNIIPEPQTAMLDPFYELKTLSMLCDIVEADGTPYSRFPRNILKKAEEYIVALGKGKPLFSPELEFHIFDDIRYSSTTESSFYAIDSKEAFWNTSREEKPNLGYKFPQKAGYQGIPPSDTLSNLRAEMVELIEKAGIPVKYHHHEVGSPGQVEVEVPFDTPLKMADAVMIMKYIIKNVAYKNGKTVTFMPKPLYGEAGNGMHIHQYMTDGKISLFYDEEADYYCLNQLGLNYLGGELKHGAAILAFTNPSSNSYKRLIPGYEAPVNLFFSAGNRSAAIRIPTYDISKEGERIEFRPPDATCNIYLAFAVLLMAAADGIEKKTDPTSEGFGPYDIDIEKATPEEKAKIKVLPTSLEEALNALKEEHDFLLKGEVFTEDLINAWIEWKLEKEANQVRTRPHPYEFELYYDF